MADPLGFRQKGTAIPRGFQSEAADADPSEQSGFAANIGIPVWKQFVDNQHYQESSKGAINAEQDYQRQMASQSRSSSGGGAWKGVNGKVSRLNRGIPEEYDAESLLDHPELGGIARKSVWDRDINDAKRESEDADLRIKDPSFHARGLAKKDREEMEAEGKWLAETDPRHIELKAKLVADTEYQNEKAALAQKSWDAKARANQIESTDPDSWLAQRNQPTAAEQRAQTVAAAQAQRSEVDMVEESAARRDAELQAKLAAGMPGPEAVAAQAERAEIANARGLAAQKRVESEAPIKAVQGEAEKEKAYWEKSGAPNADGKTPPKDFFDLGDTVSGIWDAVKGLGTSAPAAFYQLVEGMERPDKYSESAKKAFAEADAFNKEMQAKTDANQAAGTSSSVGESFREAGGSLGFSLGSMAAAIPASIVGGKAGAAAGGAIGGGIGALGAGVGAAPGAVAGASIGGTIGAVTAGMAASGTASYRMAGASFLNESWQQLQAESQKKSGRPMNEAEMQSAYEALIPIAQNTALWEAGPEAVGNAVTMGAGQIIFGLGKGLAKKFAGSIGAKVVAGAGSLATELATETMTQVEQGADQQKAQAIAQGQDPNAIKADWSAGGVVDAFKEVAPQTLALMGLMGGAGGALKVASKALPSGKPASPAEEKSRIDTALQAIDPEAPVATSEEVARAALFTSSNMGVEGVADGVLVERELAEVEKADADTLSQAQAALNEAQTTGGDVKAAEALVAQARVATGRADLTRAVLKIAAGLPLDNLTSAELGSIGYKVSGKSFTEMTDKERESAGVASPVLYPGPNGAPILTDAALAQVAAASPRARARITMDEAQALIKAKEIKAPAAAAPGAQQFEVTLKSGKKITVSAATEQEARTAAAGHPDAPFMDPVVGAVAIPSNEPNPTQNPATPQVPLSPLPTGTPPSTNPLAPSGGVAGAVPAQAQAQAAVARDATKPEQMTPAEYLAAYRQDRPNDTSSDEQVLKRQAQHLFAAVGGNRASGEGRVPVSVEAAESLGIKIPDGYVKQGDLYVFPGAAGNNPAQAAPPVAGGTPALGPALTHAKARIAELKAGSKQLAAAIVDNGARGEMQGGKINVNPDLIIQEALDAGLTEEQAIVRFNTVLDEEISHLAQTRSAVTIWKEQGSPGDFNVWFEEHYGNTIWQGEFVAKGKSEVVRGLYTGTTAADRKAWDGMDAAGKAASAAMPKYSGLAAWDVMPDANKALEGIRVMKQRWSGKSATEAARLWTDISQTLYHELKVLLAQLKILVRKGNLSPALQQEIEHLDAALKQFAPRNPKADPKKPAPGKTGDGTGKPPGSGSGTGGNGGVEPTGGDGAGAALVEGQQVVVTKDGVRYEGIVSSYNGVVVNPNNGGFNLIIEGRPKKAFFLDQVTIEVVAAPPAAVEESPENPYNLPMLDGIDPEVLEQVNKLEEGSKVRFTFKSGESHVGIVKTGALGYRYFTESHGMGSKVFGLDAYSAESDLPNITEVEIVESAADVKSAKDQRNYGDPAYDKEPATRKEFSQTMWSIVAQIGRLRLNDDGSKDGDTLLSRAEIRARQLELQFQRMADKLEMAKSKRKYMLKNAKNAAEGKPLTRHSRLSVLPQKLFIMQEITPPSEADFDPNPEMRRKRSQKPISSFLNKSQVESLLKNAETPEIGAKFQKWLDEGKYMEAELEARGLTTADEFADLATKKSAPKASPQSFTLPEYLKKSSPRYGYGSKNFTLEFASDYDKAAYILANDATKASAAAEGFRQALASAGLNAADAVAHGNKVKAAIKELAKNAREAGELKIPSQPTAAAPTGQSATEAAPEAFAQQEYKKRKTALNKAIKAGQWQKVVDLATADLAYFEETGFPDDWSNWERAKEDAQQNIQRTPLVEPITKPLTPLETLQDNVTGAIERGEKEAIVEIPATPAKPALTPSEEQAKNDLFDAFDGLVDGLQSAPLLPADFYRERPPSDRLPQFQKAAQSLISAGVDTPQKLAGFLENIAPGKLRAYSEFLWRQVNSFLMGDDAKADWASSYSEIDKTSSETDIEPQEQTNEQTERDGNGGNPVDNGPEGTTEESPAENSDPNVDSSTGWNPESGGLPPGQPDGSGRSELPGGPVPTGDGDAQGGGDNDGTTPGNSGSGSPVAGAGVRDGTRPDVGSPEANFVIEDNFSMPKGEKARIAANMQAIGLLRQIESEGRNATAAEKQTLAKYSGWGSFKNAFNRVNQRKWAEINERIENTSLYYKDNIRNSEAYQELRAWREKWGELHDQLAEMLSDEEFRAMSKSIRNAHYTALPVIDAMWNMVRAMGFKGGKVLETSAGAGYFVGRQPGDLASASQWSAVELDSITARIFSKLYPESRINGNSPDPGRNVDGQGFQKSKIPNNSMDLVIGNFPFAKDGPMESAKEFGKKLNLHNYFFARSIDKLKPGGIVIAITSNSTMDNNLIQRELIAGRVELVSAIRLPNNAFKESAGTEVTTDIIILRKKDGSRDSLSESWINVESVGDDTVYAKKGDKDNYEFLSSIPAEWVPVDSEWREQWKEWRARRPKSGQKWDALLAAIDYFPTQGIPFTAPMVVNEYFARHPEMVIGRHALEGSMYSAGSYAVVSDGSDVQARLNEIVGTLPANLFGEVADINTSEAEILEAGDQHREGSIILENDQPYHVIKGQLVPVRWDLEYAEDFLPDDKAVKAILASSPELKADFDKKLDSLSGKPLADWLSDFLEEHLPAAAAQKIRDKIKKETDRRNKVFKSWVTVRNAGRSLMDAELRGDPAADLYRDALNQTYDAHVKEHGAFSARNSPGKSNPHRFLFDEDDSPLLESLEDEVLTGTDEKGKPIYRYEKRPIFTESMQSSAVAPTKAQDIKDAVGISMGYKGRISVPYMAELLKVSNDEAEKQLVDSGLAFKNPKSGLYETSDTYLSGEVRAKLREAMDADMLEPGRFATNIEALKAVEPKNRPIQSISIILGARWLPGSIYQKFGEELLEMDSPVIRYEPAVNMWQIKTEGARRRRGQANPSAANPDYLGTDRMTAEEIFEALLNSREIRVTRPGPTRGSVVLDAEATIEAQTKASQMMDKFAEWVKTTKDDIEHEGETMRVGSLAEREFNDKVAGLVTPTFTGDWVTLPGQSGEIWLKPHRKAVLARLLTMGYGMMAHGVGSGKTYNQIALAMELRRLGKARRPVTIVQNSTIRQFAASHMKAYPHAKILVADESNFSARKRARFLAKIATGDYDSVIMTHSNISQIGHDEQAIRNYMARAIGQLEEILASTESGSQEQGDIQAALDMLQEKLDKMLQKAMSRAGSILTWEQLGVDALIVDEAHEFKNAPIITRKQRIKNLPSGEASDRAVMMQIKASSVQATTGGKNVFFATGTPITNTMAEAYTMLNFIAPTLMESKGINNFDDFATMFGRTVTEPEATWRGEIELVERFARFVNGPELVALIRSVFDVSLGNEAMGLRVPKMKGGGPEMLIIEPTEASEIFNDWVIDTAAEFDAIENKRQAFEENPWMQAIPIMVMQAGMAQAIDPRLINPNAPDDPNSKVNQMVGKIWDIYQAGAERKTAQVVFTDLSNPFSTLLLKEFNGDPFEEYGTATPEMQALEEQIMAAPTETDAEKSAKKRLVTRYNKLVEARFNLMDDIKDKLVAKGIPAAEILLAKSNLDKKKLQASFDKVNSGEIRIIVGSTARLGVGVNIQERLAAAHNLSPPRDFKPAMMEQRIGRILRQGNLHRDWSDQAFIDVVEKLSKQKFDAKKLEKRYEQAVEWLDKSGTDKMREIALKAEAEFEIIVINYGLKYSMDSSVYSMMKAKQRFIDQVLMGENVLDEFDDPMSEESASFALMAAESMGDENLKRRVILDGELNKITALRVAYFRDINNRENSLDGAISSLELYRKMDAEGIRAEGKKFAGLYGRKTRTVKTTKGVMAKLSGNEWSDKDLTPEQAKEPFEREVEAPVYQFGDKEIDTAKPDGKITAPLNEFIVDAMVDAKDTETLATRDITVNGERFVFAVQHRKRWDKSDSYSARIVWPGKVAGKVVFESYVNVDGESPAQSLLDGIRSLSAPDYAERYASNVETQIKQYEQTIKTLQPMVDNPRAFEQETEWRDKSREMIEVNRRLAQANSDPRKHRFYRSLSKMVGVDATEQILGIDGKTGIPNLSSDVWTRMHIRFRLARRGIESTPQAITERLRSVVQSDTSTAQAEAASEESDTINRGFEPEAAESQRVGTVPTFGGKLFESKSEKGPQYLRLTRQLAGLRKAMERYEEKYPDGNSAGNEKLGFDQEAAQEARENLEREEGETSEEFSDRFDAVNKREDDLNAIDSFRVRLESKIESIEKELAELESVRAKADSSTPYGYTKGPFGTLYSAPLRADSPEWKAMSKGERREYIANRKDGNPNFDARSANTQIAGTVNTYRKAAEGMIPKGHKVVDYSAGLGLGADVMRSLGFSVTTMEPFPEKWASKIPVDYTEQGKVPSSSADTVTNFSALNVVPLNIRNGIVSDIARIVKPGGQAIFSARTSQNVQTASNKRPADEPGSFWIKNKGEENFQKGFSTLELVAYLQKQLGNQWTVAPSTKLNGAVAVATKNNPPQTAANIIALAKELDPVAFKAAMADVKDYIKRRKADGVPLGSVLEGDQVTLAAQGVLVKYADNPRALRMLDGYGEDQFPSLRSATLPKANSFPRGVPSAFTEEARDHQQASGRNLTHERAGFGSAANRDQLDVVTAYYDTINDIQTNADNLKEARRMLASNPKDIDAKLKGAATDKTFQLTPADHVAMQLRINQLTEQAGDNAELQAENGARMLAYRIMRGDVARVLQIGWDRDLKPAERALAALTESIYMPSKKIQKTIASLPLSERKAAITKAAEARVAAVSAELAKINLKLSDITKENEKLKLANSKLMKDVQKARPKIQQNVLKMIQQGASLEDIKRRLNVSAEEAQKINRDAREDLRAKIAPMVAAGMSMEEIVKQLNSLQSAPLGAGKPLTPEQIAAEVERILTIGFGLPEEIRAKNIKPKKVTKTKPVNVMEADWSRPDFKDNMDDWTFDTKDRANIMQRVEIIRGLAGAIGKIGSLDAGQQVKAMAAVAEINTILAKYGTDVKDIFESSQSVESYGFDINDINHVGAVARMISTMDADFVDKATELVYANMLSGLQTMLVNATAILPATWEVTVGRAYDLAVNAVVKDPMSAQLGESQYILKAFKPAWLRAMSNFKAAFISQHPMFDRDVLAHEIDWDKILGGGGYRINGSISGKKGDIIRMPMRLLAATDDFNRTLMACVEVGTFAFRIAKARGMKPGTPEFDQFLKSEVNSPGSPSYLLAANKASRAIFSNPLPSQQDPTTGKKIEVRDLGDVVGYAAASLNKFAAQEHDNIFAKAALAIVRVSFFPFQRTPFNILRKGVRHTLNPFSVFDILLGTYQNSRKDNLDGTKSWKWNANGRNAELVERVGQQLQGATLMLILAAMTAGEGDDDDQDKPFIITGSSPFTPRGRAERETQMRSGVGPYRISFRKDGKERFGISYGRFEPIATTLAATIDLMKSVKRSNRSGGDNSQAAAAALGGFAAQAQDKSFMKGISDLISLGTNILAEPDVKDNRKFQQFLASRFSMVFPNLIKQPIREMDANFRERSDSFMQEVLYQVAPAGQKNAKRDPYGDEVTKTGNAAGRIIDMTEMGTDTVNPVDEMLLRFRDKHPDKAWFPSSITTAEFVNKRTGKPQKMTGDQLATFRELSGKLTKATLKAQHINYANPTEVDVKKVKSAYEQAKSKTKDALAFRFSK